jgi:hypothetical protein
VKTERLEGKITRRSLVGCIGCFYLLCGGDDDHIVISNSVVLMHYAMLPVGQPMKISQPVDDLHTGSISCVTVDHPH